MKIVQAMLCLVLLTGPRPVGTVQADVGREIEQVVSGTLMFAVAAWLRLRDGGHIVVPVAPVELW